jgi:hypothetical protein
MGGAAGTGAEPLTKKEALVFLKHLALLEGTPVTSGSIQAEWETEFLDTVYHLCSSPSPLEARNPSDLIGIALSRAAKFTPKT